VLILLLPRISFTLFIMYIMRTKLSRPILSSPGVSLVSNLKVSQTCCIKEMANSEADSAGLGSTMTQLVKELREDMERDRENYL